MVTDREAWNAAVHGVAKSGHNWATELNWYAYIIAQIYLLHIISRDKNIVYKNSSVL